MAPGAGDVDTWLAALKPAAPHLFTPPPTVARAASPVAPEHQGLSTAERLTRYRPAAVKRQPTASPVLSEAQQAELAQLAPTARLTAFRALRGPQP